MCDVLLRGGEMGRPAQGQQRAGASHRQGQLPVVAAENPWGLYLPLAEKGAGRDGICEPMQTAGLDWVRRQAA